MKYIPNIIPEDKRVDLSPYLKELTKADSKKNFSIGFEIIGAALLFAGICFLFSKFFIGIFFSLAGASLLSGLRKLIETVLSFSFTRKLQKYFIGILFILGIPINIYYNTAAEALIVRHQTEQKQKAEQDKITKAAQEKQRLEEEKAKAILQDNAYKFIEKARELSKNKKYALALSEYKNAQQIIPNNDAINYETAVCCKLAKRYEEAIQSFESLNGYNDSRFQIAQCYEGKGQKREAIALYKKLSSGNENAAARYEKLNPVKKRFLYYQTVCCDGSFSPSNAKGRGACSHHGGVCDWNYPIYEEYREFE